LKGGIEIAGNAEVETAEIKRIKGELIFPPEIVGCPGMSEISFSYAI
jgi:hypothetical protein